MTTVKPLRADARRNYDRLLAEAGAAFARDGVDASLEDVAKAAGVGIGTLYRHFPTRSALLEALLREQFDGQAELGRELLGHDRPGDALFRWLHELAVLSTSFRGLIETVAVALRDETSELYESCHAMRAIGGDLADRARAAGELREDVATEDMLLLVNGVAWASQHDPVGDQSVPVLLELVFSGLRPS
ncbi:TetR/AcrR family transcriptional regulator [Amycolatopsis sp. 195334CR]|uniref:TetR/AcrR family transcriptional regulator n=1 Tax=Amycolatopsis sp. 195334CR TaxID=2814588 RepID=UPI001A90802D|nr:TetR/AcrR family transcriptional regulator [Amycolatopsis sp. 195334CR]MBN6033719.1 TetR/AcrR family transcriptional regulator [Amycolatopsis sp. 195334CR]